MKLIIIAGFHRSGTSMLAKMFHSAGLFIGDQLLGALPSNPYGHFEDEEIVRIHDNILHENGLDWMIKDNMVFDVSQQNKLRIMNLVRSRSVHHEVWGFKDPRVCLFTDVWSKLIPDACWVVVFRSFIETTNSLLRRHSRDIFLKNGNLEKHLKFWNDSGYAYQMWLVHTQKLVNLVESSSDRVVAFTHQQLLQGLDPINLVNSKFGLGLNPINLKAAIDLNALSKSTSNLPTPSPSLKSDMFKLWSKIQSITSDYSYDIEKQFEISTSQASLEELSYSNTMNKLSIEFSNQFNEAFLENQKLIARFNQLSKVYT